MEYNKQNLVVALKSFARGQALPLDKDEVWESLEAAQEYAKSGTAYGGQTIKVLENGEYKSYVLNGEKGKYILKMVGSVQPEDLKKYVEYVEQVPVEKPQENVIYIVVASGDGYIYSGAGYIKVFSKAAQEDIEALKEDAVTKKGGGVVTGPLHVTQIPLEDTQVANKAYVDGLIANLVSSAPGVVDSTRPLPEEGYRAGQTWRVAESGTYLGSTCEVGDLIICFKDYEEGASAEDDFMVIQANIDGAVTGPDAAVDMSIAVFDGITGKKIKGASFTVADLEDVIAKAHEHTNKEILDTYTKTQEEVIAIAGESKNYVDEKIGDIAENTTVKEYIDNAIGSGGTSSAEAIAKAKEEAINTSKEYTNSALELVEF